MKGDIFYDYVANEFNKWITRNLNKRSVLLLVNRHKSNIKLPLSEFLDDNKIILYALSPDTTHVLQPTCVQTTETRLEKFSEELAG